MTTTRFILRVSFSVLLIVETFAVPLKGSKSSQQSSSDGNVAANLASYQGASTRHSAPVLYNPGAVAAPVHVFVQDPSLTQLVAQTGSGVSGLSSAMPAVGYSVAPAPGVAVQAGYAAPAPGVAVQAGYAAPAPGVAVQAGYAAPAPGVAVQAGYAAPAPGVAVQAGYAAPAPGVAVQAGYAAPAPGVAVQAGYAAPAPGVAVQAGYAAPAPGVAVQAGYAAPAPGVAVQAGYAAPAPGVAVQAGYAAPAPGVAVQAGYAAPAPGVAVQAGYAAPAPGVAVQAGYAAPAPGVAVQAGYAAPAPGVAVQAGYAAPAPLGAAQSGLPATQWAIAPTTFSEEASGDAQALGSSDFLPPAPQAPAGPVLQSGEISNVVKEAELGNYQQQREEFGYPSEEVSSGQGFTNMVAPGYGLGGFWGSPYPDFDYRLLNGLYPLGTYSTFSQNHEKGKDFSQVIHYLKEHASDEQGTGQQKKIFQGAS